MILSLIAAMDHRRGIGLNNQLPWHMPADLRHFKALTLGKPIVMGRKTYESIGRPLPQRRNLVLSRQSDLAIPGCEVAPSLEAAKVLLKDEPEVMIIGGGQLFREALSSSSNLYLTLIEHEFEADAFFPEWDPEEWQEVSIESHEADAENPYPYRFIHLKR